MPFGIKISLNFPKKNKGCNLGNSGKFQKFSSSEKKHLRLLLLYINVILLHFLLSRIKAGKEITHDFVMSVQTENSSITESYMTK